MAKFYRIEDTKGNGVYSGGEFDTILFKHALKGWASHTPPPSVDAKLKHTSYQGCLFGFTSLEKLHAWFGVEPLKELVAAGAKILFFDNVSADDMFFGEKQDVIQKTVREAGPTKYLTLQDLGLT